MLAQSTHWVRTIKSFSNRLQPLKIVKITLMAAESALNCSPRTALNTELAVISIDCKTVGFFLKTSKEIGKASRTR